MSNNNNNKNRPQFRGPGGPRGPMSVEKAKDFKGTIKKLWSYVKKYRIALIIIVIFAIASTIFAIIGPKILGNATTELFNGLLGKVTGNTGINFPKIKNILLLLVFLYIISAIFSYVEGLIMASVSQKITYKMRKDVNEKINRIPLRYFDSKTHGEILSIITNDIDTISQSLNQSATDIITSIVTIVGIMIMMFSINITLTIVSIIILPIAIVFIGFVMKKSQKHFKAQQDYLASVNGKIEEMYGGHNVIKVFNAESNELQKFEIDNELLHEANWKSGFFSGLMHPIMTFIGNIGYVVVALVGGYLAVNGVITVGNIQSFIQYNRQFTHPIMRIAQVSNVLQSMIAAAERVFDFLAEEEEIIETANPESTENLIGNVEFKNVKFGYNENKTIINNFSAKVKKGQKIAIVGPTGAGKTTIVKLLMRFYNVGSGEILIDRKNINNFNRSDLRHAFGMVLQDTWLFSGTIMENLRYGRLQATDDEVIEAAKTVNVHHYIQTLPEGYNMIINEESNNVSAGQKQLLTIARAILADPKVLILDEATSNVDTRTEILIQKAMDKLMKGRTSFVIAHRLSTIKNADLILVMDNGDIVEHGNHENLLKRNGFYAKLYNSQFEDSVA